MWSNKDVISYGMSIFAGNNFNICVIDFFRLYSNVSLQIKKRHGDFRDELVRRFPGRVEGSPNKKSRRCRWTVEIFSSAMIDNVICFNKKLKSIPECHGLIFVCLDDRIRPDEEALLKCSYVNSELFQLNETCSNTDYQKIFKYLERKKVKSFRPNQLINFAPLLLHADSNSTGLVFNYYYSYLSKQIGSTNNIFLIFTFKKILSRESFPLTISMILNTSIEEIFLTNCPSSMRSDQWKSIQSKVLKLNLDLNKFECSDENKTVVTYSLIGLNDFGGIVEKIRIWQEFSSLNDLTLVELKDDVRLWNEKYRPSSTIPREDQQTRMTFDHPDDPTRKCHLFPIVNDPVRTDGHDGVSTMKITTKDSYQEYLADPRNHHSENGQRIREFRLVPVYYIIMPRSCQFGPSDVNECCQPEQKILQGTIIDPNVEDRIQLAYANHEVLRSRPMKHHNRYLRRTFYKVDQIDENNEVIRYLFSAEYPNILSTLDQLEKRGIISTIEKHDDYLRFCNMLHRLLQLNSLSESIKLIQFDDQSHQDGADCKSLWDQIKEDIDQWYERTDDDYFDPLIESKILHTDQSPHVLLFYTDEAKEDPQIVILINDLKKKLSLNDFIVEDAQGNLNLIENEKRILFIFSGRKHEKINDLMIKLIEKKINKFGVLRDVFILINDAIRYFPCRFIRSIPYLTFNLQQRSPLLNTDDINEMTSYLKNMNILSKSYQINFEDFNSILNKSSLQCTSIGKSCGTAFYFNYIKLILSSSDHHFRIGLIENEIEKEYLIDDENKYFSKWIFLIPSIIKNTNQIISSALSITENQQNKIGFQLSQWSCRDPKFKIPDLFITTGGVYQRCYSTLSIYRLKNLGSGQSYYFAMEIPAALHSLECHYENVLSNFNFGKFDPVKQGFAFTEKVKEYFSKEEDQRFIQNILFVYFDNSQTSINTDPNTNFDLTERFLRELWINICSSLENS